MQFVLSSKCSHYKIDYGESYERYRVLNNYPRIKGKKLERMEQSIANGDEEELDKFSLFGSNEVHDCLSFLEGLFDPVWETTEAKLQRTLIVALAIHGRVKAIQKESEDALVCDEKDGYSDTKKNDTASRAKNMVAKVCSELGDAEQLKAAILSMDLLKTLIAHSIGCESSIVKSLNARQLRERIQEL